MKKFMIEREMPGVGGLGSDDLAGAAAKSCDALRELAPRVQWQYSYVAGDKTFCVYLAEDASDVRKHSEISGFPADTVNEITGMIDPTTADA
ncbi:DUF4242 domain-containing protein [Roseovarius aestuariivivens]|uniref:DUF4242 domain-containing protein n=1 Tax=Roseovarius aestuariivivens TaxID=1888910 RepID=UPI0010820412|nr:DUF4242 domain-containing protein [Roseovarius aestuariivivens]